jgi:hypothetical protein
MQPEDILRELTIIKARLGKKTDIFVGLGSDTETPAGIINGTLYPDGWGSSKSAVFCWANTWEDIIECLQIEANKIYTKRLALRFTTNLQ